MPFERAILFTNGQIADLAAAGHLFAPGDLLIAVDGGARYLNALGKRPHLLIGDLDSLDPDQVETLRAANVTVHRYPIEKDETDLELALLYAAQQGARTVIVAGALGGRIDQTLANLFLLGLPELAGLQVRLDDGREAAFLIRQHATIRGAPGDTLSLLPLGGPAYGVTTANLRYPLRAETLFPERSRGVSNQLLETQADIHLRHGLLICIHTRYKELTCYATDPYTFA
jgi:thiamine pyrophosphokinase